uniref:Immunoglobulin superfamily containing leucine rich repeat n=1 Tax=Anser brachyrhynchus TaxID=132585 RepID=A0A8B9B7Y9_9AVES
MRLLLCCLGIAALLGRSLACPSACSCSAKKNGRLLAECAYKELLEVPRGLSPNVSILTLSANRIGWLRRGAFAEVPEDLRSLWLNDNQLTTLAEGTFDKLPSLSQLQIFNNPFNCSCKVFWLKRWTESTSVSITKGGATLCVAPGRLKGRAVTDIPEHHCVAPSVQLTYLSNLDNSVMYDDSSGKLDYQSLPQSPGSLEAAPGMHSSRPCRPCPHVPPWLCHRGRQLFWGASLLLCFGFF